MTRPLLFISHLGSESAHVNFLHAELSRLFPNKVDIFNSSNHAVRPGDEWLGRLRSALRAAKALLVIASPSSVSSPWVNFEIGGGLVAGVRVIPCCIKGMTQALLPPPLNAFQALDLETPEGRTNLVREVAETTGLPPPLESMNAIPQTLSMMGSKAFPTDAGSKENAPRRFDALLGTISHEQPVRLVIPTWTTPARWWRWKPLQRRTGPGTKDTIRSVAVNDLRALCSVAKLLGRESVGFRPITDEGIPADGAKFPLISFGLTTNSVTHMYWNLMRTSGRKPLFARSRLANGNEAIELANGTVLTYDKDQFGVVARVTPDNDHADRKWLFCAGLGRTGTEAAANYLCDNWPKLIEAVGKQDFVTVVKCASGKPQVFHSSPDNTLTDSSTPSRSV